MSRLTIQEVADRYEDFYKRIETYGRFMNRLVKDHGLNPIEIATYEEYKQIAEWLKELQHYKDLEEQGRLIELPCKVGDTVYFPIHDRHDEAVIEAIGIEKDGIRAYWVQYDVGVDVTELWDEGCFEISELGKTVFLTKEAAEAKLAVLKGE